MISHFYSQNATLYTITESVSTATGENIKTNSTGVDIKCKIRPLTARELDIQNKNNYSVTHRLYCDYSTGISNTSRVLFDSETYEIKSITNPFTKNEFLQVDMNLIK